MAGLGVGGVVASLGADEQQGRERVVIDPSLEEEKESDIKVMVGTMPALSKVTNVWLTGEIEVDEACNVCHTFPCLKLRNLLIKPPF